MQKMSTSVAQFHQKHGFPVGLSLVNTGTQGASTPLLNDALYTLAKLAESLKQPGVDLQEAGDPRVYRLHLMVEELAEVAEALQLRREADLADGLADLAYVVAGTAVTYNIPLEVVVDEVHQSNMTKQVRTIDNLRMKDKGPDYRPPDIMSAVERGRAMNEWTTTLKQEIGQ